MVNRVLIDTGPIVALLDERDQNHDWAVGEIKATTAPLVTCDAVISEAFFLLAQARGTRALCELLERRAIAIDFDLSNQLHLVLKLIRRYADMPMSLADACLVRMSELDPHTAVLTTDAHFSIYRRNGRQVIPLMAPRRD